MRRKIPDALMAVFVTNPNHVAIFGVDLVAICRELGFIFFANAEKLNLKLVAGTGLPAVFDPVIKGFIKANRTTEFDFRRFVNSGVNKVGGTVNIFRKGACRIETKQ